MWISIIYVYTHKFIPVCRKFYWTWFLYIHDSTIDDSNKQVINTDGYSNTMSVPLYLLYNVALMYTS